MSRSRDPEREVVLGRAMRAVWSRSEEHAIEHLVERIGIPEDIVTITMEVGGRR